MRLSCTVPKGEHHITIPAHAPLKIGTLSAILDDLAAFHAMTKDQLASILFG
jgi:hypothetical protein